MREFTVLIETSDGKRSSRIVKARGILGAVAIAESFLTAGGELTQLYVFEGRPSFEENPPTTKTLVVAEEA